MRMLSDVNEILEPAQTISAASANKGSKGSSTDRRRFSVMRLDRGEFELEGTTSRSELLLMGEYLGE
jgi:hypothetical protein